MAMEHSDDAEKKATTARALTENLGDNLGNVHAAATSLTDLFAAIAAEQQTASATSDATPGQ